MKKKLCALLLSASMLSSLAVPAFAAESGNAPRAAIGDDAVYLGVKDYGRVTKDEKESFEHRFFVDGHEETFTIPADGGKFELQNKLQEGYIYDITISGYTVTGARWKRAMWPVS